MIHDRFLEGKRVLITSFSFASFGGAELSAVELAEQLVKFGATPYFFSYDIDGPLVDFINNKFNTKVLTDDVNLLAESENALGYRKFNISDYDYIWIGANTLPISILKQLNSSAKLPKFIFIHMSSLIGFPLDAPLMPDLERKIALRILSVGNRTTTDCIHRILGEDTPVSLWPNPAPAEFKCIKKREGTLKKIAVISSSHPTDEVMAIEEILKPQGIVVDYIGRYNENQQVVDAGFYDKYDLVIGIGKNVKYSLVSGVPVYIYGRFGGCGYLQETDHIEVDRMNFSGRGYGRKTSGMIAREILEGYGIALKNHNSYRSKHIEKFSIDIVAKRLFIDVEKEEARVVSFSEEYINLLVSVQINLMQNIKRFGGFRALESKMQSMDELVAKQASELEAVYLSHSWVLTKPLRVLMRLVRDLVK